MPEPPATYLLEATPAGETHFALEEVICQRGDVVQIIDPYPGSTMRDYSTADLAWVVRVISNVIVVEPLHGDTSLLAHVCRAQVRLFSRAIPYDTTFGPL
jgi:hypothetical protein